jgi:putative phage-type endonuclease
MIPSGATIAPEDREAWLAERRKGLGASDCAAALGLSPYRTPLDLYYEKLGELPPEPETPAMRRGKRREAMVLDEYAEDRDVTLVEQVFVRHPALPWMTATLDGVVPGDDYPRPGVIVEAKWVGGRMARDWGEPGTDDVPRHVLAQAMHQLIVAGGERCDVAAVIAGGDLQVYPVRLDPRVAAAITAGLGEFWHRVRTRDPDPAWLSLPADAGHLARLWPGCEGEVELDDEALFQAEGYSLISAEIRRLERARDRKRATLLAALGNARAGVLPDGRRVRRSVVEVAEATVTRKARTEVRIYIPRAKEAEDGDGDAA